MIEHLRWFLKNKHILEKSEISYKHSVLKLLHVGHLIIEVHPHHQRNVEALLTRGLFGSAYNEQCRLHNVQTVQMYICKI